MDTERISTPDPEYTSLLPESISLPPPEPEPVAPAVTIQPGRWWILLLVVLGAGWATYLLRNVLTPFVLAFLLAYVLAPFVEALARLRVPRPLGALLVFSTLTCGSLLGTFWAVRSFHDELSLATQQVPMQFERLLVHLEPWTQRELGLTLPHDLPEVFAQYGTQIRAGLPQMGPYLSSVLFGTLNYALVAVSLLIIPIFSFYLLADFDRIARSLGRLVPRRWQRDAFDTVAEVNHMISGYMRGQLLAMAILGTLYATGLRWIGLRLAIPIGMLTGALAFIPYVGFAIGSTLALTMAVLEWHDGTFVLQVIVVMLVVQIVDGLLVTPRVVGRSVGLGPVEVLFAMAGAGTLFGFVGVLLAVPLGATVKILVRRALRVYRRSEFYRRIS